MQGDNGKTRSERKKEKKPLPPRENKRRGKKKTDPTTQTVMRLGHSIREGGRTTIQYTQRAMKRINTIAQGSATVEEAASPITFHGHRLTFTVFVAVCLVVTLGALMIVDNGSIEIDKQTISVVGLPNDLEGYRILHLSDLHGKEFGVKQASLLRSIDTLTYDMVLITGDMIGVGGDPEPFYELLEGLNTRKKVYFIAGDSDPAPLLSEARPIQGTLREMVLADWVLGAEARGANYLSHTVGVNVGTSVLWLSPDSQLSLNIPETLETYKEQLAQEQEGVASAIAADYQTLPFTNYRFNQLEALQAAAAEMAKSDDVHIALAHYPPSEEYVSITQSLAQDGDKTYLRPADVILAGHYCGGGWRLPIFGALYVPNSLAVRHGWFPSQSDVSGLKSLGATMLYTSAGLGMTDRIKLPDFRILNSPQISLLTLTSAITDNLLGD